MPDFNAVASAVSGAGGVIIVLIYMFWQGQKGEWLFKSVHETVVASLRLVIVELEKRLVEKDALYAQAVAIAQHERERGDKWQQLYLESRHIVDKSITVAAQPTNATPTGQTTVLGGS